MKTPTLRAVSSSALAALLAACAAGGGGFPGAGTGAAPAPAPAPVPVQTTPPPPPEPPPPAGPAAQAQAQKLAMGAVELLETGQEDQARAELERALSLDGNNKLANNLMRQITADPVAALGRESFIYVVRPSDTLSRIAGRFMGDIYSFYILARYNDIRVPRQVAGGQHLRIPGKAPPPGSLEPPAPKAAVAAPVATPAKAADKVVIAPPVAAPAAPPPPPPPPPEPTPGERAMRNAQALERSGQLDRAMEEYKRAATLDEPGAAAKIDEVRKKLVDKHTLAARTAFVKQDLAGSIRAWDHVLELDPSNETAKLERQKALRLKQKADELK